MMKKGLLLCAVLLGSGVVCEAGKHKKEQAVSRRAARLRRERREAAVKKEAEIARLAESLALALSVGGVPKEHFPNVLRDTLACLFSELINKETIRFSFSDLFRDSVFAAIVEIFVSLNTCADEISRVDLKSLEGLEVLERTARATPPPLNPADPISSFTDPTFTAFVGDGGSSDKELVIRVASRLIGKMASAAFSWSKGNLDEQNAARIIAYLISKFSR